MRAGRRLLAVLSLLPLAAQAAGAASPPEPRALWRTAVPPSGSDAAEWDHEMLYIDLDLNRLLVPVSVYDEDNALWELDGASGKVVERHRFGERLDSSIGVDGSLVVHQDGPNLVYHAGAFVRQKVAGEDNGQAHALRHGRGLRLFPELEAVDAGGTVLWKRPVPTPTSMGGAEVWNCYEDRAADVVYILYDDDHLVALDAATGAVRWFDHTRVVRDRLLPGGGVLLMRGNKLTARAASGDVLWTFESKALLGDLRIWPGGIYALDDARLYSVGFDGRLRWEREVSGWPWCCGPDGACYCVTPSIWMREDIPGTKLVAVDATGETVWSMPHAFSLWETQLTAGQGVLYLHSRDELMALVAP